MPRNARTSKGIATITSQAPSPNFDQMTTSATIPVVTAPTAFTAAAPGPACVSSAQPVTDHSGLGERERREDADDVEVDQRVDVGVVSPDQRDTRIAVRHQDSVREHQPVAEVRELAREEAVTRDGDDEAGEDLDDADDVHRVGRVAGDDVVERRREVARPVVGQDVGELVEPEQDRGDGERDAEQERGLGDGVVAEGGSRAAVW